MSIKYTIGGINMAHKLKIILMMALCLVFATTVAFANRATYINEQAMVPDILSMHGTITEINQDRSTITIVDKNGNNQMVALDIRWNTKVLNGKNGNNFDIDKLKVGDELTAYYSPIMTRSIPPRTNAFALVVGDGQHDGIYTKIGLVEATENGKRILNSNGDLYITIPDSISKNAQDLKPGKKMLVWYDMVALSMPGQTTATKVVILK